MMKKLKKFFSMPIFTLISYVMALLTFIYLIYTLKLSYDTVLAYIEQGSLSWSNNFGEIISFFVSNCISYVFYCFAFVFFGKVIKMLKKQMISEQDTVEEINEEMQEENNENIDIENNEKINTEKEDMQ